MTVDDSPKGEPLAVEAVYERIGGAIRRAELRPNKRLVEEDLAQWLNISRTPIREALLRLEQEGLVVRDRGWAVRDHNPEDIRKMLEARLMVEGYASRLAARHATAEQVDELEGLAAQMEKGGISRPQYNLVNNQFHQTITRASGNDLIMQFQRRTELNYWNLSVPVVFDSDHHRTVNLQHRQLIQTLRDGDEEAAERIAREHVQGTMDIVLEVLGVV